MYILTSREYVWKFFSGILTGKYKRGVQPGKSEGRIGVIAQDESKALQSAPAWSKYDSNENYWKLMAAMEKCATKAGTVPVLKKNTRQNIFSVLEWNGFTFELSIIISLFRW